MNTTHTKRQASFHGLNVHYFTHQNKPPTDLEISRAVLQKFGISGDKLKGTYIRAIRQGWGNNLVLSNEGAGWQLDEIYFSK